MAVRGEQVEIAGVRLSNPDKVLYPEQGTTKLGLAEYYVAVADYILPHVAWRPITLVRCPSGRQQKCFYQRHAGPGIAAGLNEVKVPGFDESGAYLFVKDLQGLIALVQMGVLEVHPWGARVDRPDRPDRIVFDLDPGEGVGFKEVVAAALELRAGLESIGLTSFARTTGGKGLHVVVPIARRYDWPRVKGFARDVAEAMAAEAPGRYLSRMSKAQRRGRIFVDYLRNDRTSTAIASYSTRARAGAPVATPLAWKELTPRLDPAAFEIRSVPARLKRMRTDPWADIGAMQQRLPADPGAAARHLSKESARSASRARA